MFRGQGRFSSSAGYQPERRPEKRQRNWPSNEDQPKRAGELYDHRPAFAPPPAVERVVDLLTNAISLSIDASRFELLHIYTVKFDGPRPMSFKLERLKSVLLSHKSIHDKLPRFGAFYDYRDEFGVKIFAIQLKGVTPTVAEQMAELATETEILVKARGGGEETWRLTFMEEKGSPLASPADNQTQFMQFANHVAKEIVCTISKFTLLNGDRRMVRLDRCGSDAPGVRQLRSINGILVPGYAKKITCTRDGGIIWTFRPQYTLVLNTDMGEYLRELAAELHSDDRLTLIKRLLQKRVTVSTCYAPSNLYRVVTIAEDVLPTSELEVVEKNSRGELIRKKTTHLEYLQTRYPNDRKLNDRRFDLTRATMIGVAMVGRQNKGMRTSRTVFIPAPLLNIVNIPTSSLSTQTRVDITKFSQLKASESFASIDQVRRELSVQEVRNAFKQYGITLNAEFEKIQGTNNVAKIISIEVPGGGGGRLVRLAQDEQCSFMRDFTRSDHAQAPHIRQWMLVARKEQGQFPEQIASRLMDDLVRTATQKGWEWPYRGYADGWSIGFEDEGDLTLQVEKCLAAFKAGTPRPDLIIGLIPHKDEHDYTCVKRFAFRIGCPSQVITRDLLNRLQTKAFWKILSGVCGKLMPNKEVGGVYSHPWKLHDSPEVDFAKIPALNGQPGHANSTCCIAISTYTQSQQARGAGGSMGWGIAATSSSDCTGLIQDFGELDTADKSLIPRLDVLLTPIIRRLHYNFRKDCQNIIIYRRGVSEGLIPRLLQTELPAIRKALKDVLGAQDFDPETRILKITWPQILKENGEYQIEVPCKTIADGQPATHVAKAPLTRFTRDDGLKIAALNVTIPPELVVNTRVSAKIKAPGATSYLLMPPRPRICFIVTNRSNAPSLLTYKPGNPRDRDGMVTPGGTLVDKYMKCIPEYTKTQDEFYIIPGSGAIGFAPPVHYIIVQNEIGAPIQLLSDITLKLSFMFYNHQGSNKTPHIIRISETAAEQALTVYRHIDEVVKQDVMKAHGFVPTGELDRLKDSAIFL